MTNQLFPLAAVIAFAAASTSARTQEPAEWAKFERLPAAAKDLVGSLIDKQLPESTFLRALRTCGEECRKPHPEREKRLAERHGKRVVADEAADPLMPLTVRYLFGLGAIESMQHAPVVGKKGETQERTPEELAAAVHQALLGIAPGADRALATLMGKLDIDTRADAFAAFLHAWRNGDESFYEALDRTAGTKDSIFFYDAMLGDFRTQFGSADSAHALGRSLTAAHDALHAAFLAYRQYRGFREAVAWSLVLPPERALPKRLHRYETAADGTYSLRQQVVMVCHGFDGDVQRVVDEIVRTAPALPDPVWSGAYDPYPAWTAFFTAQLPHMIEAASTSDAFLAAALARRTEEANTIAAVARAAIEQQGKAHADTRH